MSAMVLGGTNLIAGDFRRQLLTRYNTNWLGRKQELDPGSASPPRANYRLWLETPGTRAQTFRFARHRQASMAVEKRSQISWSWGCFSLLSGRVL